MKARLFVLVEGLLLLDKYKVLKISWKLRIKQVSVIIKNITEKQLNCE